MGPNTPPRGGDVWVMPALGGNARRVAVSGNFPSWSPDGTGTDLHQRTVVRGQAVSGVSASGGEPREVKVQFSPGVNPAHLLYPLISSGLDTGLCSPPLMEMRVRRQRSGRTGSGHRTGPGALLGSWLRAPSSDSNGEVGTNQSLWRIAFDPDTGTTREPARPLTIGRGADLQAASSRDK